jgi:hypothetical protein
MPFSARSVRVPTNAEKIDPLIEQGFEQFQTESVAIAERRDTNAGYDRAAVKILAGATGNRSQSFAGVNGRDVYVA